MHHPVACAFFVVVCLFLKILGLEMYLSISVHDPCDTEHTDPQVQPVLAEWLQWTPIFCVSDYHTLLGVCMAD